MKWQKEGKAHERTTWAFSNRGWRICIPLSIFIQVLQGAGSTEYKIPLLLKALLRCLKSKDFHINKLFSYDEVGCQ
jgi:hypothetical protein